jgi:hypothetical protein
MSALGQSRVGITASGPIFVSRDADSATLEEARYRECQDVPSRQVANVAYVSKADMTASNLDLGH